MLNGLLIQCYGVEDVKLHNDWSKVIALQVGKYLQFSEFQILL